MPRKSEIAADARALYGPPSVRPAAGDMGDGALWVDPGDRQSLWQVQSGNWRQIALPPVDDDSSAAEVRGDTFIRADDPAGWGTASDGHVWDAQIPFGGTATVSADQGVLTAGETGGTPIMLLGPAVPSAGAELLVRWQALSTPGNEWVGPQFYVLCNADRTANAVCILGLNGGIVLGVQNPGTTGAETMPAPPAWAGGAFGALFWSRFRAAAGLLSVRTWAAVASEPDAWDAQWAPSQVVVGRRAGLTASLNGAGDTLSYDHFSAMSL